MPVYFIRAGNAGPVKIGWANDVEARRRGLQTSHHQPLRLIRTIEGRRQTEGWLHGHFAAQRLEGEWFRFQPEMATVEPPTFGPPTPKQPAKRRPKSSSPLKMCWVGDPCAACRADPDGGVWNNFPTVEQRRAAQRLEAS